MGSATPDAPVQAAPEKDQGRQRPSVENAPVDGSRAKRTSDDNRPSSLGGDGAPGKLPLLSPSILDLPNVARYRWNGLIRFRRIPHPPPVIASFPISPEPLDDLVLALVGPAKDAYVSGMYDYA